MFIKQRCFLIIVIMRHREGRLFLLTLFNISWRDDKRDGKLNAARVRGYQLGGKG